MKPNGVRVVMTVKPDGSLTSDFQGFQGRRCLEVSAQLQQDLARFGVAFADVHLTPKPTLLAVVQDVDLHLDAVETALETTVEGVDGEEDDR